MASTITNVKDFGPAVVDGIDDVMAAHVNDLRTETQNIQYTVLQAFASPGGRG